MGINTFFSYIVVVNFTGGEDQSILEKAIDPIQIIDKIDHMK